MELSGKLFLTAMATASVIAGFELLADGFTALGAMSLAAGLGLFGFVYWGLQQ